jgi:hypothetical protein
MASRSTLAAALIVPLVCGACSRQATIALQDGSRVEGRILGGRGDALVLANDEAGQLEVPRTRVREIRHPGTPAIVGGSVLLVTGAVLLTAAGLRDCSQNEDPPPEEGSPRFDFDMCEPARAIGMLIGGTTAATGIGVGVYGIHVKQASHARASGEASDLDARGLRITARF